VAVEDFLHQRLERYLAGLGVTPEQLPIAIAVEAKGVVTTPRAEGSPPRGWVTSYLRAYGAPALEGDIQLAQTELARASAELHERRRGLAAEEAKLEEAARAPSLGKLDGSEVEPLGAPPVPPPWSAAIGLFALASLLALSWQLALPLLSAAGVATGDLAGGLSRSPATVVLVLVFALGASTSLFTFADAALRRLNALADEAPPRWRRWWSAASALASLALAATLAWFIAGPSAPTANHVGLAPFLIAIALPLATSKLLVVARRLHAVRAEALQAARVWADAHKLVVARWTRQSMVVAAEERQCARLEAERAAALRRLHALRQRVQLAERFAVEAREAEADSMKRLCRTLATALERDHVLFLRAAAARHVTVVPPEGPAAGSDEARRDPEPPLRAAG
jgi:hypothetical protein